MKFLTISKKFHVLVERETGKNLKCLRTDNEGEYTSKAFEEYCMKHVMRHEKTTLRSSQQNVITKCMNKTILKRIQCLLSTSRLPRLFWCEAMRMTCYLINLSPSRSLDRDIPKNIWRKKDVQYKQLQLFGCKAFMHALKELWPKSID